MTSHNPAQNSQNSPLDRDTLAKVNAHADRSIDRLFADIDELLSGDLHEDSAGSAVVHRGSSNERYPREQQQLPAGNSRSDFSSSRSPIESLPASEQPKQKKRLPLWFKIASGVGVGALAVGGGLLWLVNEGKIELPKTLDTSWLPFQASPRVAPADAKFADYMQKSLAKIESTRTQAPAPTAAVATPVDNTATTPATTTAPTGTASVAPAGTVSVAPTGTVFAAPSKNTVATPQPPILLTKTFTATKTPSASFKIADRDFKIAIGQKIGKSGWSLVNITKREVLLKKTGGEIRSIRIGQQF
jgi:hypothetical protein